jgi:hypothetical protein
MTTDCLQGRVRTCARASVGRVCVCVCVSVCGSHSGRLGARAGHLRTLVGGTAAVSAVVHELGSTRPPHRGGAAEIAVSPDGSRVWATVGVLTRTHTI